MNETNKSWFCHLLEVAYDITEETHEITDKEFNEMVEDGTESIMGAFFSDNLTDSDIAKFKYWMEEISNRNQQS